MIGRYAVFGLGRFGRNVALHLARHGQPVLAVDRDPKRIQEVSESVDAAVVADSTDEAALAELGVERLSCAVVAIGAAAQEASILTTALLRQLGVPRVVARSLGELHGRVLQTVGAHEVINPEEQMGRRLAQRLAYPNALERLELGEGAELVELRVPQAFAGKTLVDLDLRRSHAVQAVAIRRGQKTLTTLSEVTLEAGDLLVVIGNPAAIERLAALA